MKLVFFYGPPAVGKVTIAKLLAEKTGYKLLHNHLIVNPVAEIFSFDMPTTRLLTREFRLRIIEEAAKIGINVIMTFGIAGNDPFSHIADVITIVEKYGGEVCLVHLTADEQTLLSRVENTSRKEHGKNLSREKLKEMIKNNQNMFDKYANKAHLTFTTTEVTPETVVAEIITYYELRG